MSASVSISEIPVVGPATVAAPTADAASLKPAAVLSKQFQAKQYRVIVLGAGMSGLACARELVQRGYQVLVVEARDRVGGRLKGGVKTNDREGGNEGMKTVPGTVMSSEDPIPKPITKSRNGRRQNTTTTPVDLGGALIHGIDDNPIYAITQQMGVPTRSVSDCLLFDDSGWPVDTREDQKIAALFNECLEETFDRIAKATTATKDSSESSDGTAPEQNPSTTASASIPTDSSSVDTFENHPPNDNGMVTKQEKSNEQHQKNPLPKEKILSRSSTAQKRNGTTWNNEPAVLDTIVEQHSSSSVPPDSPATSFGDVFDRVCHEKGAPRKLPLFQWHQANLEVSCGASFPDLGYKWNDDEPYGYDGDHVAVKTSWKPVVEGLAEGIDILFHSPVKNITMVVPDTAPPSLSESRPPGRSISDSKMMKAASVSSALPKEISILDSPAGSSSVAKKHHLQRKRLRTSSSVVPPLPSRRSRRLRGDDANARRSSRITKGQNVDRFFVSEFSTGSYLPNSSLATTASVAHRSTSSHNNKKRGQLPDIDENQTRIQVTLENGSVLEADAVVCTLPLGILKLQQKDDTKHANGGSSSGATPIQFYPPLSARKQNAIQRLGCGLLNKCVLSFSHVFWQDSDFLGLAHPSNSYLVLNASVFTNKPILTFMYGGTFAKEIESWTDNEIVADCLEVLKVVCGRDIPDPLDYVVTRWGKEQYSRMAFSFIPPGVDGTEEIKAMSEAVYDPFIPSRPILMFAGEHTTPFHPSTIHGAFLSGIREAYRLDLFVEPEANNNLEFDEEHLYQHTFAIRKQFQPSPEAAVESRSSQPRTGVTRDVNSSQQPPQLQGNAKRQHRRRGAASVMNLRERSQTPGLPNERETTDGGQRRRQAKQQQHHLGSDQNSISHSPARRSRRSFYSVQPFYSVQQQKALETTTAGKSLATGSSNGVKRTPSTEHQKKHISSLEGRTIMRALESYGYDYEYIQSTILPVFGSSTTKKTLAQMRARCQQLTRSMISSASPSIPRKVLDFWITKSIYKPPPWGRKRLSTHKMDAAEQRAVKPRVGATRRSFRESKQRHLMNL